MVSRALVSIRHRVLAHTVSDSNPGHLEFETKAGVLENPASIEFTDDRTPREKKRYMVPTKNSTRFKLVTLLTIVGCTNIPTSGAPTMLNPVEITEWPVPWEHTRPRDPFVDQHNRVWFVGQRGDYIGVLDPNTGRFKQYPLEPGTGPHNLIVDDQDQVWYAGNRAAHIGKLDPTTGHIIKHAMPDPAADDPHTLVFGKLHEIWFTVQGGNFTGNLRMDTGRIHLIPLPTSHARPYGIVVDRAYTPWFTEFGTNKLGTIDRDTHSVREVELPRKNARPRRLAITSDGAVWFVDYAEGYVGRLMPSSGKIEEWQAPGGDNARPYGMAADENERVWFVETGSFPNRLVGFDTREKIVLSITPIKSGGGSVRHMVYHKPTQTLWFGTDTNTIARVTLP